MADVTVEQLNKILNTTEGKIDETYNHLASLYTKQATQLSIKLENLKKGLDKATNEEKKAEEKNTKSVLSPLDTIATHLHYIRRILAEQFRKTSLGTADKDVGVIKRLKDPTGVTNSNDKVVKAAGRYGYAPHIMAALITAAIVGAIKQKLKETWSGMAQLILKPASFFGKQIVLIESAGAKLVRFMTKFPRLFIVPLKLIKILGALGKLVPQWIKWGSFLFRYHIVEPITRWGGTIFKTLGKGFPRIARFFGILKKIAWPLTLFLETLDMVNLIYKGEDGFIKNTEKLAKEISEKGPLGRALYGLTHSLTTITAAFVTAGQTIELKWTNQLVPWVEDTTHNIFNNFLDLVNDMKNKFIDIYNWVARKIPGMTPITEEQARSSQREHAWHMISRGIKKQYGDKPGELGMGSMAEQKILEFKERTANLEKLTGEAFTIDANEEWIKFSRRLQDAEEKYTKKRLEDPNLPRLNKNLSPAEQFELFMKAAQENPTPGVMNQNSVNILNQISPPRPIEMHGAPIGTHQLLIAPQ